MEEAIYSSTTLEMFSLKNHNASRDPLVGRTLWLWQGGGHHLIKGECLRVASFIANGGVGVEKRKAVIGNFGSGKQLY